MAPRKQKPDDDAASTTSTEQVLKPNTTKAKVEKPKSDKAKTAKLKAVKKEKADGELTDKPEKEKVVKATKAKKDIGDEKEGKVVKEKETKGEKVKAVTGEEAVQLILQYLTAQNRPYSATEVSANLHGKVTKTVADKLLKEMEQNNQIMGKATKKDGGGQWVFWPIQDPSNTASPTELASMETLIETLRSTNPTLKTTLKSLTIQLTTLRSAPTTTELSSLVSGMQVSMAEKKANLEAFKSGEIKMVTKEELEKVEKEYRYWGMKRRDRKRAFEGLEDMLLQGMSKEDVWEKAGLEEDVM